METNATSTGGTPNAATIRANRFHAKISRIVIQGPVGSKCYIYTGGINNQQLRDGSNSGEQDIAEYPQGLTWPAGTQLIAVWDRIGTILGTIYVDFDAVTYGGG